MTAAAVLLLRVTRGQSLFADEWGFFLYRGRGSAETLFAPNNGSLFLVPVLVYRLVFGVFGPDSTVLRLILVALELLCAGLFFQLARSRVGDGIALGAATLLLFLGAGFFLVATVAIALYLAVALGLAALIAIQRRDLRGDVVACVLLVLAVVTYSAALPFAAGAAIAIILRPAPLRWQRAWVVAVPLLLYGAWRIWAAHYAQHPKLPLVTETVITPGAIAKAPGFIGEAFAAGLASATGLFRGGGEPQFLVDQSWGVPLAALFVAAALARFLWPRRPPLDRGVWMFMTMPLVYWTALSLPSIQVPGTNIRVARLPNNAAYQYTSVMLLLLAAAALASGVRISRPTRIALGAVLFASLVPNVIAVRQAGLGFRVNGAIDRAELTAVELVGSRAARVQIEAPSPARGIFFDLGFPPQDYLSATKRFGSAAARPSSLTKTTRWARWAADLTLIRLYELAPRLSASTAPRAPTTQSPSLESGAADLGQPEGGCVSARPRPAGTPLSFTLPRGGFTLQAAKGPPVALNLRRFADSPGLPTGSVAGGARATLRIPADASAQPWRLLIFPAQPVRVCVLSDAPSHPSETT